MALVPTYGQDNKELCTDAHMKVMDADVAKMTAAAKQKSAKMHLDMSNEEEQHGRVHQAHGGSPQGNGYVK
jgi:hypothetical protein